MEDIGRFPQYFRGLFIINSVGVIRHLSVNDLPVGRNVDEVLRLVQAFLYTDVHGEVCPSGWKPGDLTVMCLLFFHCSDGR
jgi:alkyl hydroperoxide reductase subunit AhpC